MRDHDEVSPGSQDLPLRPEVPAGASFGDRDQPADQRGPLDEFGLPVAWRREETESTRDIDEAWGVFEAWASARRFKPFPAELVPVALFLAAPPVSGPRLREVWEAVDQYHSRMYWHEGANPVLQLQLGFGVWVSEDGVVTVEGSTSPPPDD